MQKIAIITDTDSSLPDEIAASLDIIQVPITIQFGEESFVTGENIDDQLLFKMIDERGKLPSTSAPSPNEFKKAFEKAFHKGYEEVICICVSSTISATYQAALNAAELCPGKEITVVDSQNLTMAQGFIAMAAAEAAKNGLERENILEVIKDIQPRVHVFGALPTLKYLAMGGRMSKLKAGFAETLDIKPILTSRDGKLDLLEKVRTLRKAEERLIELAIECSKDKKIDRIALIHVNNEKGVLAWFEKFKAVRDIKVEPLLVDFTPGLSVHAGSGVIGFVFVTD